MSGNTPLLTKGKLRRRARNSEEQCQPAAAADLALSSCPASRLSLLAEDWVSGSKTGQVLSCVAECVPVFHLVSVLWLLPDAHLVWQQVLCSKKIFGRIFDNQFITVTSTLFRRIIFEGKTNESALFRKMTFCFLLPWNHGRIWSCDEDQPGKSDFSVGSFWLCKKKAILDDNSGFFNNFFSRMHLQISLWKSCMNLFADC